MLCLSAETEAVRRDTPMCEERQTHSDRTLPGLYNSALVKRIVRHDLIENIGLQRSQYWGFFELTNKQFTTIAEKGGISNLLFN